MEGNGPRPIARSTGALLEHIVDLAAWLVLPLSLLLFLQWPLRELLQAWSREANDLGQILFALYVSVAVTAATRSRAHLAADAFAHRYSERARRLIARVGALAVLLPWSTYLVVTAAPVIAQSVRQLEAFPETFNPGYFIVKVAAGLLGVLVALQAIVDASQRDGRRA